MELGAVPLVPLPFQSDTDNSHLAHKEASFLKVCSGCLALVFKGDYIIPSLRQASSIQVLQAPLTLHWRNRHPSVFWQGGRCTLILTIYQVKGHKALYRPYGTIHILVTHGARF
jgi:hypothetical protein